MMWKARLTRPAFQVVMTDTIWEKLCDPRNGYYNSYQVWSERVRKIMLEAVFDQGSPTRYNATYAVNSTRYPLARHNVGFHPTFYQDLELHQPWMVGKGRWMAVSLLATQCRTFRDVHFSA